MKVKVQLITYLYIIMILLSGYIYEVIYFYISLLVHELGHIVFIKLFKKKIDKIEISPIGGILFINEAQNDRNYKEFFIYLGGPLFSLLLFLFVNRYSTNETFLNASFYILFLNLLPILPLDGAKIIGSMLQEVVWYKLASKILSIMSIIILFVLLYISIDNYLYVFLIMFFIYKNLVEIFNIKYDYHSFLIFKYLYPNRLLNIKVIKKHYYKRLYKGFNNYYDKQGTLISETEMLKELLNENNY